MSVFKGHEDLSLNRYYYSFYSFSQSDPNTIKSFVYDQNQTLISSQDISFNSRNVPAMLTFLENTQSNPYALGKSNDEYLNMDIAFAGLYKKALSQRQQRTLMTFVNNTYKNVYYGTVEKYIVTIVDNGGTPVVYFNGDTSDPNPLAIIHSNGLYIFDQSDPSNTNYPLEFRAIDTQNPYTTNVIIEGTPGTPNSYSVITVDNTTPTNLEYYINSTEPDVGTMKGDLFMGVYVVKTVENWASQTVFTIKAPFQDVYYDQPDLSFNSGDIAYFYVGDTTMTDFSLVFGPTVDSFDSTFYSSYVSKSGNVLTLDLSNTSYPVDASGVYYFEDTSAGMGYVEAYTIVVSASDYNISSNINFTNATGGEDNRTWTQYGYSSPYSFANGTYNILFSDPLGSGQSTDVNAEYILDNTNNSMVFTSNVHTSNSNTTFNSSGSFYPVTIENFTTTDSSTSTDYYGSWLQITMPYKLLLKEVYVNCTGEGYKPKDVYYFGSNDGINFTYLTTESFPGTGTSESTMTISNISTSYYTIRMVINTKFTGPKQTILMKRWILSGDVVDIPSFESYTVEVSNSSVFRLDSGDGNGFVEKLPITFTNGVTYIFDQSDPSNAGFPIVFGTSPESSTFYTNGVTVVGTPGQPGAYTKLEYNDTIAALYYYNNIIPGMGYDPNAYSYYVTVAGTPSKFYLNSVRQLISFTASTKYYFYQYDSTNTGYPIVFDETADDVAPYFTDGVTTVGTPGQAGAYTILDLSDGFTGPLVYFSSGATDMGFAAVYTVKVVQNWAGNNVFSIQAPGEDLFYNQPDLSFNAGDSAAFDVGDSTMSGYSLVFGTEIDVSSTKLDSPYVSQSGTIINLNLPSDYTGGAVYYFEDTSAGMGYVEATTTITTTTNDTITTPHTDIDPPNSSRSYSDYYTESSGRTLNNSTISNDKGWAVSIAGLSNITSGNNNTFMTIDCGSEIGIVGLRLRPRGSYDQYVKTLIIDYSSDGSTYYNIDDGYVFDATAESGNKDFIFTTPVLARYIKIIPRSYNNHGSMKAGLIQGTITTTTTTTTTMNTYTVTVSNEVFFIDTGSGSGAQSKPQITFTDGETYVFDQSDDSNDGYPIVFGTTVDDMSTLYTTGVTVVGTPGQPGAYTKIDYTGSTTLVYFSSGAASMGYVPEPISNTSSYTNVSYTQPTTVTEENNNKLYKFIANPTNNANSKYQSHYQITLDQTTTVHYVVVGGGGAGGRYVASTAWRSAGGGGGEVMQGTVELPAGTYDVKVGSGGHWVSNTAHTGNATGYMMDGFPSSFHTITARGGKGGPATVDTGRQSSYKIYGLGGGDSNNGGDGIQVSVNGTNIWLGGGGGGGRNSGSSTSGGQGGGGNGGYDEFKSTAGADEKGGGGGAGASGYSNTGSEQISNKWGYGGGGSSWGPLPSLNWVDETNFGGSGVVYLWHDLESYV